MSKSKPRFHKQENRYSCAPACLRMVLSSFGVDLDEAQLRALTDCSPFGTDAFQIVQAARSLGFEASRKWTLASLEELASLIDEGLFPIVYIDLWPIRGGRSGQYHSIVVVGTTAEHVIVFDPQLGERIVNRTEFMAAWTQMHCLTIVISK